MELVKFEELEDFIQEQVVESIIKSQWDEGYMPTRKGALAIANDFLYTPGGHMMERKGVSI